LSGVAVQCCPNQPLIDKVIPMLFLNEDNECDGWSSLLILDKNKKVDAQTLLSIKPEDPSINLATSKPYIAICFYFGASKPATAKTTMPEQSTECIRISAHGLVSKVFPVLDARTDLACSLVKLRDIDSEVKKAADPERQYILAQYGTSNHNLCRGSDILLEDEGVEVETEGED
jgi:hypothetical protein